MKNIVGTPVSGENFLDREKEIRTALRLMQNGNSFLLLGLRKTGKSSFLKQVAYFLKQDSAQIVVEIDCSTFRDLLDFYKALHNYLPDGLKKRFRKTLSDSRQIPTRLMEYIAGATRICLHFKHIKKLVDQ